MYGFNSEEVPRKAPASSSKPYRYFDFDGDLDLTLDMAGLVLHVESRFGIQIETELLERIATVGDMLDVLEEKIAANGGRQAA